MQTTTVVTTCDRCGKSTINISGDRLDMRLLEVGVYAETEMGRKAQWCRPCCEAVGLIKPQGQKGKPETLAPTPPTIEDMLRMLIEKPNGTRND